MPIRFERLFSHSLLAAIFAGGCHGAVAQSFKPDIGRLTAITDARQTEAAGGDALTSWALLSGFGARDSYGANVTANFFNKTDYSLVSAGVAVGFANRIDVSVTKQDLRGRYAPLHQLRVEQDIFGLRLKLVGDALYDHDSLMPQISVGLTHQRHRVVGDSGMTGIRQFGVANASGTDYTISATKLFPNQNLLLNGTLRATKSDHLSLLGFGGGKGDKYDAFFEASATYLINRKLVVGTEFRMKTNNLGVDNEKAYSDIFLAYFPTKNLSLTVAYASLGDITVFNPKRQNGAYMSLQLGF